MHKYITQWTVDSAQHIYHFPVRTLASCDIRDVQRGNSSGMVLTCNLSTQSYYLVIR